VIKTFFQGLVLSAVAGSLAGGCGGSNSLSAGQAATPVTATTQTATALPTAPAAGEMTIVVTADKTINKGRPLHMVVRAVDLNTYLQDSYSTVAGQVVTPDDTVIGSAVVYPGHNSFITVAKPAKGAVATYFLFTQPGSSWKTYMEAPLPAATKMVLGTNGVAESGPVTLPKPPAAPKKQKKLSKRRKIALAGGGVGVAGLATGTVFGLLARNRWNQTSQYCNALNECSSQVGVNLGNQARTYGRIANVSFVIGAVGIAAGAALWLTTPSSPAPGSKNTAAAVAPLVGPNQAGITVLTRF
jgi:hypothetical protein